LPANTIQEKILVGWSEGIWSESFE
jgi:hypothetical protein